VVDDHEGNRKLLSRQLQLLGYSAEVVATAEQALDLWSQERHEILLTDWHLPAMSGFELAEAIRSKEEVGRRTLIIAVTGRSGDEIAEQCVSSGVDEWMTKPVSLERLGRTLAERSPGNSGSSATGTA